MKTRRLHSNRIQISPGVYLYLSLLLLVLPLQYIASFLISGIIHEIGHLLALRTLKVPICRLRITVLGTVIETYEITPMQEMVCAAAGPLAGILTCMAARTFPLLGICAFIQTAYNLIPLYPFDGGRICKCCMAILSEKKNSLQR